MADEPYRGGGPGRFDINGHEWWACDPYPTWFRWEGNELHTEPTLPWRDESSYFYEKIDPMVAEEHQVPEDLYVVCTKKVYSGQPPQVVAYVPNEAEALIITELLEQYYGVFR